MVSEYTLARNKAKGMKDIHLGQEVQTVDGIGIVVELIMPFNGRTIEPIEASCTVWYGGSKALKLGIMSKSYSLSSITAVV